jgi:tetratricopeptide (TPR) repeat protein
MEPAVQNYRRSLEINPANIESYIKMGGLYFKRARYEEAARWYLEALGVNPDNIDANYDLGLAYRELGRNEDALEYFKKAAYFGKDEAIEEIKNMGADLINVLQ